MLCQHCSELICNCSSIPCEPHIANHMKTCKALQIRALIIEKKTKQSLKSLKKEFGLFLKGHTGSVNAVVITYDNQNVISGSADNTIRVWSLQNTHQESVLKGHTDWINALAITSDNKFLISGSSDCSIRIWNLKEKSQQSLLQGHTQEVVSIAIFHNNEYIVSGGCDNSLRI